MKKFYLFLLFSGAALVPTDSFSMTRNVSRATEAPLDDISDSSDEEGDAIATDGFVVIDLNVPEKLFSRHIRTGRTPIAKSSSRFYSDRDALSNLVKENYTKSVNVDRPGGETVEHVVISPREYYTNFVQGHFDYHMEHTPLEPYFNAPWVYFIHSMEDIYKPEPENTKLFYQAFTRMEESLRDVMTNSNPEDADEHTTRIIKGLERVRAKTGNQDLKGALAGMVETLGSEEKEAVLKVLENLMGFLKDALFVYPFKIEGRPADFNNVPGLIPTYIYQQYCDHGDVTKALQSFTKMYHKAFNYNRLERVVFKGLGHTNVTYTPTDLAREAKKAVDTVKGWFTKEAKKPTTEEMRPVTIDYNVFIERVIQNPRFEEGIASAVSPERVYEEMSHILGEEEGEEAEEGTPDQIVLDHGITPELFIGQFYQIFTKYEEEILPSKKQEATQVNPSERKRAAQALATLYVKVVKSKLPEAQAAHEKMQAQWAGEEEHHEATAPKDVQRELAATVAPATAARKKGAGRRLPQTPPGRRRKAAPGPSPLGRSSESAQIGASIEEAINTQDHDGE